MRMRTENQRSRERRVRPCRPEEGWPKNPSRHEERVGKDRIRSVTNSVEAGDRQRGKIDAPKYRKKGRPSGNSVVISLQENYGFRRHSRTLLGRSREKLR